MSAEQLHQRSVVDLSRMIHDRSLSSRELLDHYLARIDKCDDEVNAVVTRDVERAESAAAGADEEIAAGRSSGALHGIPVTVKDALAVEGMRSTGGAVELAEHVPTADADVVAAVRAAGAIPYAKTNVPRWSGDLQTYNEIFGTTNNPWDTSRTPGGSSGGPAASVALGYTGFELGTDIGGSIRIPSAFCGVVGHKPSFGLVPCGGYIDRPDYGRTEPDINVHGPIARSVDDLELLLDLLAAPRPDRRSTVRHSLPPARHEHIRDYRVALWSDEAAWPASSDVVAGVEQAGEILTGLGARVDPTARPRLDVNSTIELGSWLLAAAITPSLTEDALEFYRALMSDPDVTPEVVSSVGGFVASHGEWLSRDVERTKVRDAWHQFFGDIDAIICPVTVTTAFPHVQEGTFADRVLSIDDRVQPYADLIGWTVLIGMAYLPATVVPIAETSDGLPVAVQIVGPYMEDRTPIAVARALRSELGPLRLPAAPQSPEPA